MKTTVPLLLLVLISSYGVNSAKILGVMPVTGRSHYILVSTLMRALAEKGHDVTVISCWGEKNPPKNGTYRDIVVTGAFEEMQKLMSGADMNLFDMDSQNPLVGAIFMATMFPAMTEITLKHENVQKLINSGEKFDVVIVEQFANDAQKGLSTHFGAPLVSLSGVGANYWANALVGNPSPPSYIPDIMLDYSVPMAFCERVVNSFVYVFNELLHKFYIFRKHNEIMKKYIPNAPAHISDVLYNNSIILMNSHPSINQPVPYVPSMVDIGGFHVKPPKKLPQDLQEFLDGAKDGVIYFSMGSNLKSAELPNDKRDAILKTFAKLKQKVLWKWEEEDLPGKSPNVKTAKWLPQQDILAHPNVKLFITHGGLLSTIETIYHGVPILAIPIFGDQKMNARSAVKSGYGVYLAYSEIKEETLTNSINEVLNNQKYKDNVQKRSKLFHDRIVSPLDTAIYWIEYVIRHKGAPHLRVAALDLPWYKYLLLDVIGVIALVLLSSLLVFCYIVKLIARKMCSKKTNKGKKSKKE
ncbi:UDP-glycosyltransferase UGT5-like [Tribolium castaneum]|uniref:UDP-glycosyltransferase UGT5-like n=1 Tax=Tribolium castaneum TaxID=7070 RepID=UPI00017587F9|nr:PREDICTED: UDP-glucuronosyltransferase 1-7C-like [Tribolium castaneum]|eukprot:XP_015838842.1 PREDICTED: UDP-glucuronosyltransferase 1-7C-like [Tribolium castaneum]